MQADIPVTERAADKVQQLIAADGGETLKLRVFITGGGCNGFSYGFTFDDSRGEDDAWVERNGTVTLVDAMSYPFLAGAEIDYVEDLNGAQFVVNNPNAESTCGCGSSFSL